MSTSVKVIVAVVILGVFGLGYQSMQKPAGELPADTSHEMGDTRTNEVSTVDSSDESLEQDLLRLDAELKASAQDDAAIGESMNDKPIAQEE